MPPRPPPNCLYFHDLAQNQAPESVVMLREPAGEMDRKSGFTSSPKSQTPIYFQQFWAARRFTAFTFCCYCTSNTSKVKTKSVRLQQKCKKTNSITKKTRQKRQTPIYFQQFWASTTQHRMKNANWQHTRRPQRWTKRHFRLNLA